MIEICYQDDEAVDASYTQDTSPAILSEFEQPEEEPAAGPALAFESLATVTSNDNPGHDPVRAYLRKMSSVALLTREGEVELGKRMEDGQRRVLLALLSSTVASHQLLELGNRLRQQATQSDASASESEEHLAEPHEAARTERICKVMDDVQRMHGRLLKAENAALSAVKTTRERASREVAMLRHEMADALLSLRLDQEADRSHHLPAEVAHELHRGRPLRHRLLRAARFDGPGGRRPERDGRDGRDGKSRRDPRQR
jgi:RNA polymerase primary sigma factor